MSKRKECEKKIKNLNVKNLCNLNFVSKQSEIENLDAKNLSVTSSANLQNLSVTSSANLQNLNVLNQTNTSVLNTNSLSFGIGNGIDLSLSNLTLNGIDVACALNSPTLDNSVNLMELTSDFGGTGPTKPSTVNQQVWDALLENASFELTDSIIRHREGRQAIKDTLSQPTAKFLGSIKGNVLTILSLETGQPGVLQFVTQQAGATGCKKSSIAEGTMILAARNDGTYIVNISQKVKCAYMQTTCPPSCPPLETNVDNFIYGYNSKPLLSLVPQICVKGTTGTTGPFVRSIIHAMTFNLDVTYEIELSKSDAPRVVSVLVQTGYIEKLSGNVIVQTLYIGNKQFGPTIDRDFGENFAGSVNIPSDIIETALANMPDPNNTAAVQLVVFIEKDLCVWNQTEGICTFNLGNTFKGKIPTRDTNTDRSIPTVGSVTQNSPVTDNVCDTKTIIAGPFPIYGPKCGGLSLSGIPQNAPLMIPAPNGINNGNGGQYALYFSGYQFQVGVSPFPDSRNNPAAYVRFRAANNGLIAPPGAIRVAGRWSDNGAPASQVSADEWDKSNVDWVYTNPPANIAIFKGTISGNILTVNESGSIAFLNPGVFLRKTNLGDSGKIFQSTIVLNKNDDNTYNLYNPNNSVVNSISITALGFYTATYIVEATMSNNDQVRMGSSNVQIYSAPLDNQVDTI